MAEKIEFGSMEELRYLIRESLQKSPYLVVQTEKERLTERQVGRDVLGTVVYSGKCPFFFEDIDAIIIDGVKNLKPDGGLPADLDVKIMYVTAMTGIQFRIFLKDITGISSITKERYEEILKALDIKPNTTVRPYIIEEGKNKGKLGRRTKTWEDGGEFGGKNDFHG